MDVEFWKQQCRQAREGTSPAPELALKKQNENGIGKLIQVLIFLQNWSACGKQDRWYPVHEGKEKFCSSKCALVSPPPPPPLSFRLWLSERQWNLVYLEIIATSLGANEWLELKEVNLKKFKKGEARSTTQQHIWQKENPVSCPLHVPISRIHFRHQWLMGVWIYVPF